MDELLRSLVGPRRAVPATIRHCIGSWGIPPTAHGLSLVGAPIPIDGTVGRWVMATASGRTVTPGDPLSGKGLLLVADLALAHPYVGAMLQDLCRQRAWRERVPVPTSDYMRWATPGEITRSVRDEPASMSRYTEPELLVVSPLVVDDHWTLATLSEVLIARSNAARPTVITAGRGDYVALQGRTLSNARPAHTGLQQTIASISATVEL